MKTTLMIATVLAAGTSAVYAQEPPASQQVPTLPAAASAPAPGPTKGAAPSIQRLSEVQMLEDILVKAMNQGASALAHQMELIDPGTVIQGTAIVSPAHARGLALEGYGVLFVVDVPLMNLSVVWTQREMAVQNLRDLISEARRLRTHVTSPEDQQQLDARIQLLTNQLYIIAPPGAVNSVPSLATQSIATPVANASQQPAPGSVVATTTAAEAPAVAPLETRSTDELYSDAIKTALMNAMVNHSSALMLDDDEWLTVAARDSGPTIPGAINNRSGIILRIKGSDLAAFRANKLSRDEVMKKIEIKEWR